MFDTLQLKKYKAYNTNMVESFKSIILLTDFSDPAKNAIQYAIDAFGENAEYNLVNAYYARTSSATLLDLNEMLAKESEQGLTEEKNWILEKYPNSNLTVKTHSVFGSPVDSIRKMKKSGSYDIVIMGTKGASGVDAVLFGSVASNVIRDTVVPVISIPPNYKFSGFKHVVFASDGKEIKNFDTVAPIAKLQDQFKSEVTLFSVTEEGKETDWSELKIAIKNAHYSTVESDDVAGEVTKFCQDKNADLLVILPKHTGFFDRLFHHSVSKELVEQAKMPILALEHND